MIVAKMPNKERGESSQKLYRKSDIFYMMIVYIDYTRVIMQDHQD